MKETLAVVGDFKIGESTKVNIDIEESIIGLENFF